MLFGKERLEDLELGKLEEEEEAEQGGGALEGTEEMEKAENVVAVTEPRKEDTSPMSTDSTPSAMSVDPPRSRSSSLPATFLPAPNTSLPAPSPYSSLPMCFASPIPPLAVSVMSVSPTWPLFPPASPPRPYQLLRVIERAGGPPPALPALVPLPSHDRMLPRPPGGTCPHQAAPTGTSPCPLS